MSDKRFECKLCKYTPSRNTHLQRHLNSAVHLKRVKEAQELKRFTMGPFDYKVGFYCEMCDFRCYSLDAIQDHIAPRRHRDEFDDWLAGEYERAFDKYSMEGFDFDLTINEYGQVYVQVYE